MVIRTSERWRLMSVRPNGEVEGVEVAHADTKEELDILLARERLRTLEEDTKVKLGEKEKMALIRAHVERPQRDVEKRVAVEESSEKITSIQEGLRMKKVALELKVDKSEKEKQKLGEIEKLLEVSNGKEKRAEEGVEVWKRLWKEENLRQTSG